MTETSMDVVTEMSRTRIIEDGDRKWRVCLFCGGVVLDCDAHFPDTHLYCVAFDAKFPKNNEDGK